MLRSPGHPSPSHSSSDLSTSTSGTEVSSESATTEHEHKTPKASISLSTSSVSASSSPTSPGGGLSGRSTGGGVGVVGAPSERNQAEPESIFEIEIKIGQGAFGSVFKAKRKDNGETVAVKILDLSNLTEQIVRNIKRELQILKGVKCPQIVTYFGNFFAKGNLWIALEFCKFGSLMSVMQKLQKPFTEKQVAAILWHVTRGLDYLHGKKILHRDIKAANVLLNSNGEAKLADFGVSVRLNSEMDRKQTVIGSPYWMAPELIIQEPYGSPVDVWSLGVTAVELAEMHPPYHEHLPMSAMFLIASGDQPPPRLGNPSAWSPEFNDFLTKCLQRNPLQRATMSELVQHAFLAFIEPKSVLLDLVNQLEMSDDESTIKSREQLVESIFSEDDEVDAANFVDTEHNKPSRQRSCSQDTLAAWVKGSVAPSTSKDMIIVPPKIAVEPKRETFDSTKLVKKKRLPTYSKSKDGIATTPSSDRKRSGSIVGLMGKKTTSAGNSSSSSSSSNSNRKSAPVQELEFFNSLQTKIKSSPFAPKLFEPQDKAADKMQLVDPLLFEIVAKMSHTVYGVNIRDRKKNFIKIEKCFSGIEAIDWLYENLQLETREQASHICHKAKRTCLIRIANPDSNKGSRSKIEIASFDETGFYRFNQENISKWKEMHKEVDVTPGTDASKNCYLVEDQAVTGLTNRDWQLLLAGANTTNVKFNEVIIKEGARNSYLYKIKSGSVKVMKQFSDNEEPVVLNEMGPGRTFGEMSVFDKLGLASATVVGGESGTELWTWEVGFILQMFGTELGLAKRFYASLALKLGTRLKELPVSVSASKRNNELTPQLQEEEPEEHDLSFQAKFNLPATEYMLKQYNCVMKKSVMNLHGELYISSSHVCFIAKVFGYNRKVALHMKDIINSDLKNDSEIWLTTTDTKKYIFRELNEARDVHFLITSLINKEEVKTSRGEPTKQEPVPQLSSLSDHHLSKDDWKIILEGFIGVRVVTYKPRSYVIRQDSVYEQIFQIARGSCIITKKPSSPNGENCGEAVQLGVMESGEMFGEISFLDGGSATASVIAGEQGADVYIIEKNFMNILFVRQPRLAGRFYNYLCHVLSERLKAREKTLYANSRS